MPAATATVSAAIWTTITLAGLAAAVLLLMRTTRARRPGLALAAPLAAAAAVRVTAAVAITVIPGLGAVRPVDESQYLLRAGPLLHDMNALGSLPHALVGHLQIFLIAGQNRVMGHGAGVFPLRPTQIAIAVVAIAIVAIAVNDLAGPRAGAIVAWILALEPGGVLFSVLLLKESLALLGESVVMLACVRMYTRRDVMSVLLAVPGLALTAVMRPHIGAALGAAFVLVTVHAAFRPPRGRGRALTLAFAAAVTVIGMALAVPRIDEVGRSLQRSQKANTSDNSNLKLEQVDFSSAGGAAKAVGRRTLDFLMRPYPWQVANTSQRLGLFGTLCAWALLFLTLFLVLRRPRRAFPRVAPLLYLAVALTIGYAVTTGNAGTGFRYRTHLLVALAACVSVLVSDRRFQLTALRPTLRPRGRQARASRRYSSA